MSAAELDPAVVGLLTDWLGRQRWFGGKGRPISGLTVTVDQPFEAAEAEFHLLVLRVDYTGGPAEYYQVPVGVRTELPGRLEYALIGEHDGRHAYDALHDPAFTTQLAARIAAADDVGPISFRHLPDTDLPPVTGSRLLGAEQSNSSVVFDDTYILKLFRRLAAGANPDLEITRALALAGSTHIAPPLGWLAGPVGDGTGTYGLLQPFLVSATEGWAMATTSVRDLYAEADLHADEVGGDFAAEAERLGAATAEVHALLARTLPSEQAGPTARRELADGMLARLDAAVASVAELAPYRDAAAAVFEAAAAGSGPLALQRVHGDYHLGQVLRTGAGWVILDFEGEPAKPLAERVRPDSAMRDVAGMLRSFDYAARFLLTERPRSAALEYRAGEWAERNRSAFCAGYAAAGVDPADQADLLAAYELDKAVYEVVYEARMRPAWLSIPLGAVQRLVTSRPTGQE